MKKKLTIKKKDTLYLLKKFYSFFITKIFLNIDQKIKKNNKFVDICSLCWLCMNIFKLNIWNHLKLIFIRFQHVLRFSYVYTTPFFKGSISKYCIIFIKKNIIKNLKQKKIYYLDNIVITLYKKQTIYLWRKIKFYFSCKKKAHYHVFEKIFILNSNIGSGKSYFLKTFIKFTKTLLVIFEKNTQNSKITSEIILKFFNKIYTHYNKSIFFYFTNFNTESCIYTEFFNSHIQYIKKLINVFYFLDITYEKSNILRYILFKNLNIIEFSENSEYEIIKLYNKKKSKTEVLRILEEYLKITQLKGLHELIARISNIDYDKKFMMYDNIMSVRNVKETKFLLNNEKLKISLFQNYFLLYIVKSFHYFALNLHCRLNFLKKFSLINISHISFLVTGPRGSGKSIFLQHFCTILKFKYIIIHFYDNVYKEPYFKKLSKILFYLKNKHKNVTLFIKYIGKFSDKVQNSLAKLMLFVKNYILNLQIPVLMTCEQRHYKHDICKKFIDFTKIDLKYLNFSKKKKLFSNKVLIPNSCNFIISKYIKKIAISNYTYLFYKYFLIINSKYFKLFKELLIRTNNSNSLIKNFIIYKIILLQKILLQKILRNYYRFRVTK
uniref:Uncharacterized protein n=1 Tax=Lotharella vacuolata TaxID=74820 RepID=A0A0H5BKX4_9EUKA|nr:hypothetical protein [Lotharella vacuolata]